MEQQPKLQCQRIGCNATFTEVQNLEGSCRFHASGPLFHDGTTEWSCCKKRSHDFSLFLEISGCTTGKHAAEKPVLTIFNRISTSLPPFWFREKPHVFVVVMEPKFRMST